VKNIYTIPGGTPFLPALARLLLTRCADTSAPAPARLAGALVILPTQRAVSTLRTTLLEQAAARGQTALLLPRLVAVTDPDPAGPPLILPLAHLIQAARPGMGFSHALGLAEQLATLLDELARHDLTPADLKRLEGTVEATSRHWQDMLTLLLTVWEQWRIILHQSGLRDSVPAQMAHLAGLAASWADTASMGLPGTGPSGNGPEGNEPEGNEPAPQQRQQQELVIAAGLIGLFPYLHRFQQAVLHHPQGMVILPGLDTDLSPKLWDRLPDSHPQARLRALLAALGVAREAVQSLVSVAAATAALPAPETAPPDRAGLLRQLMLPADHTPDWRTLPAAALAAPLSGITQQTADTLADEALSLACAVRAVVATPGRTVAVVTANRTLASLLHQQLRRWDLHPDDSSGTPLRQTPCGVFAELVLELTGGAFSPVTLADVLRHPYCRAGLSLSDAQRTAGIIERSLLRGPRRCHRLEDVPGHLRQTLGQDLGQTLGQALTQPRGERLLASGGLAAEAVCTWLDTILAALQPLRAMLRQRDVTLTAVLTALHITLTRLSTPHDKTAAALVWQRQDGLALRQLLEGVVHAAGPTPERPAPEKTAQGGEQGGATQVPGGQVLALMRTLLDSADVHMEQPLHARAYLWGPLEAQLHQADTVILADLNEQSFPSRGRADMWLNRALRQALGLELPEQRTSLEAHVFCQLLGADQVILSRARRVEGAPTQPSRWLMRLRALLGCHDLTLPRPPEQALSHYLDAPSRRISLPEPLPAPPASARPERLSVSDVERLSHNPYGFYARTILRLVPLEDLDLPPDARVRGTLVHRVLERFCRACPDTLPHDAADLLAALAEAAFRDYADDPAIQLFWRARLRRIAAWVLSEEQTLRPHRLPCGIEHKGQWTLSVLNRLYTLEARADRIDRMADGGVVVVDYKTGIPPSKTWVQDGRALQLPLLALMVRAGGFGEELTKSLAGGGRMEGLEYWHLKGSRDMGGGRLVVAGESAGRKAEGGAVEKTEEEAGGQTGRGNALVALLTESERFLRNLLGTFANPEQPYPVWPLPWHVPTRAGFDDYAHLARQGEWGGG
jgi:ATP-dependent helicase/nuclease subunit B